MHDLKTQIDFMTEQTPIELARQALQQVIDYREGKGKFNVSGITDPHARDMEMHDLWYEVESDVRYALEKMKDL